MLKTPRRGIKAISPVVATIILLAVAISLAVAFAGMIYAWYGGVTSIVRLDTSDTRVILRTSDGYLKIQLSIRNLGASAIQISKIIIDSEAGPGIVTFSPGTLGGAFLSIKGETISGTIYATNGVAVDSTNRLTIPSGGIATAVFIKASGGGSYFTVGNSYHGTIQYAGGAVDFQFFVESW
jgi:flagellin-like protein